MNLKLLSVEAQHPAAMPDFHGSTVAYG